MAIENNLSFMPIGPSNYFSDNYCSVHFITFIVGDACVLNKYCVVCIDINVPAVMIWYTAFQYH